MTNSENSALSGCGGSSHPKPYMHFCGVWDKLGGSSLQILRISCLPYPKTKRIQMGPGFVRDILRQHCGKVGGLVWLDLRFSGSPFDFSFCFTRFCKDDAE